MTDPKLFGKSFRRRSGRDTWAAWAVFLSALFGLPAESSARQFIQEHTGRSDLPNAEPFTEAYVICGRRGGKSIIAALIAAFLATLRDYSNVLAPGETGVALILASDRKQGRVIFSYVRALIEGASALKKMVTNTTKETIELANHVRVEIHTSSYRAVRGYSIVACLCDELAFWQAEDGSNPAGEVLRAVRPAMSSIPGAVLLGLSSPYAKRGVLFDVFTNHYGREGSQVLVWKAGSREMNATISERTVESSRGLDPSAARSEWDAEFRDDLESFIPLEVVEARIISGRHELPPVSGTNYTAFVDPSGGSSDSFALAIGHRNGDKVVLDVVREVRPKFSPESVVAEFAGLLRQYRIWTVTGDAYAGEWPREQFRKHSIEYRVSEQNRSELYLALLPLLMSGQAELLDSSRLKNQLVSLERRVGRTGKDSIDHASGSHDDLANAAAGALTLACGSRLELGLVNLINRELNKREAAAAPKPEHRIEHAKQPAPPEGNRCPQCDWHGIAYRGTTRRCSRCAHEWFEGVAPNLRAVGGRVGL